MLKNVLTFLVLKKIRVKKISVKKVSLSRDDPNFEGFWGHLGSEWFPASLELKPVHKLPQAKREAKKEDWSTNYFERSETLRRRDRSTNCPERRSSSEPLNSLKAIG